MPGPGAREWSSCRVALLACPIAFFEPVMADSSVAVPEAVQLPSSEDLARAEKFTRERFVHPGEEAADALGPGSGRRHALDDALKELDAGAKVPSTEWRRHYSL